MGAFLVYFSKDFISEDWEERRALQWEQSRKEGRTVGYSADSERSVKAKRDELIFFSLPWGIKQETGSHWFKARSFTPQL